MSEIPITFEMCLELSYLINRAGSAWPVYVYRHDASSAQLQLYRVGPCRHLFQWDVPMWPHEAYKAMLLIQEGKVPDPKCSICAELRPAETGICPLCGGEVALTGSYGHVGYVCVCPECDGSGEIERGTEKD